MRQNEEDRRLKIGGFGLALAGCLPLVWAMEQVERQWPPPADQQMPLLLAAVIGINVLVAGLLVMAAGFGTARPAVDARRRRAVLVQLVVANVLLPVIVLGNVLDRASVDVEAEIDAVRVALTAVGLVLLFAAWRLWRRSQRQAAPTAAEVMARDQRPPVVYLRSFRDDGTQVLEPEVGPVLRWWKGVLALPTAEEQSTAALEAVGPVVAIGRPGEPLPELGAARVYVSDERWQAEVLSLMERAALVVLRIGGSPGLLWEIDQSLARLPRRRLILVILGGAPVAQDVATRLAPVVGPAWTKALPAPHARTSLARRLLRFRPNDQRIGALVCFPEDRPRVVALHRWRAGAPWWRDLQATVRRLYRPMRAAWKEAIDALGLAREVQAGRSRAIAIALALFLGAFGAHWFFLGRWRRGALYVLSMPLLLLPIWLGWIDALRFIWVDRQEFARRFAKPQAAAARRSPFT